MNNTNDQLIDLPVLTDEMIGLLETLSNIGGVSGNEIAVRSIIRDSITGFVDELHTDALGNLIALKKAKVEKR
jgi:endoglucanase